MPRLGPEPSDMPRVLVVEDDQGVLDLIGLILEQRGFIVDTATTSRAALGKAQSEEYDLAILDLMLPDADGVILRGKLKRLAPGLDTRTIFMTGYTREEIVLGYLKSLGVELLHKPFDPDQLIRAVERLK